jgi:hypothetical protein
LNYLLDQCRRQGIKVNPPKDIGAFVNQLKKIRDNKRKALNLLLEDI